MTEGKAARAIGSAIGSASGLAASRPVATLLAIAAVSSVVGIGLANLQFDENLLQILPRGNPNTDANLNVSREFPGHHTYTALILKIDEGKWAKANAKLPNRVPPEQMQDPPYIGARNISDEVYIRGMDEMFRFYHDRAPNDVNVFLIAWNSHVKLVNWSNEKAARPPGTDVDESFSMPGTDRQGELQYALDWQTVMKVAPTEVTSQASPDWDVMRAVFTYEPGPESDVERISDLGAWFHATTNEYRAAAAAGELQWDVFDSNSLSIFDSKVVVDAHQNELAQRNLLLLGPLVAVFVVVSLWFAFRSMKPVLVGAATLVLAVVWTYGLMGWLDIPLNVLNLTVVPLILGVGIDFSIHIVTEFLDHKSKGMTDSEAFRESGYAGGFAMFVATFTTIIGLVVMIFSPSLLIAQLGLVSAISLAVVYLLSILFIPALFTVLGTDGVAASFRPSNMMPRLARAVGRRRVLAATLAVLLTVGLYVGSLGIDYETFGNPAQNFPEGDDVRDMQDQALTDLFSRPIADVGSNWIILQGDITDPAVHAYVRDLSRALAKSDLIRDDSVVSIYNLIAKWVAIKEGSPFALVNLGQESLQPSSTYPSTSDAVREELEAIYASPFATYASLFVNRNFDITVILVDLKGGTDYAGASEAWDEVWGIIHSFDDRKPEGLEVAMGGYTAFSYLFITYEMPWVQTMALVTSALVVASVAILTRDWRATLLILVLNTLTSVWWLGVLPYLDIGLSIMLTMPLIFIYCIGSDYGLHLAWSMHRGATSRETFSVVGKAVLYSAITDFGAFLLFYPMENLMMSKSMLATAIAILVIFVATMLFVPLFYSKDEERAVSAAPTPPLVELRAR